MRRDTLRSAIATVVTDLRESGVREMMEAAIRPPAKEERESWMNFAVIQHLLLSYSQYGEAEKKVVDILGVSEVYSPQFWQKLNTKLDRAIIATSQSVEFAVKNAPPLADLLKWNAVDELENTDSVSDTEASRLIHIVIPEDFSRITSPQRIITVINSITGLYEVCSHLQGDADTEFGIVALDSGSDKSIIFAGVGEAAAAVRGTISDVWDRVLMGRSVQAAAKLDLIAKSLPIMDRIKKSQDEGSISPEQAELMRRKAIECATGIVDAGAMTTELEQRDVPTPRTLIHEKQLLLTSQSRGSATSKSQDEIEKDARDLIVELSKEVERLKRQAQGSATPKPRRKRNSAPKRKPPASAK